MYPTRACKLQQQQGQVRAGSPHTRCEHKRLVVERNNGFKSQEGAESKGHAYWIDDHAREMSFNEVNNTFKPYSGYAAHHMSPYHRVLPEQPREEHHTSREHGNLGLKTYPVSPRMAARVQLPPAHEHRALQHYRISSQPIKVTGKTLRSYLYRESVHLENLERQKKRFNEILRWCMISGQNALQEYKLASFRKSKELFMPNRRQDSMQILGLKEKHLLLSADIPEVLAPVRVSAEIEGVWLSDTLTWNVFDNTIDIEKFACITCDDLAVPASLFAPIIVKSMRDQVRDFVEYSGPFPQDPPNHSLEDTTREKFKNCSELRILIKLDITIDSHCLLDQFEWDIACGINSPDAFANHMCHELNLPLEFRTAIAHSIREQTAALEKSLYLVGYSFDGFPITGEEFIDVFLPTVTHQNVFREARAKEVYGPLYNLTNTGPEKISKDLERDARRKRRQTCRSRRASALPHLVFQRTNRTRIGGGAPSSPLIDTFLMPLSSQNNRGSTKKSFSRRQRRVRHNGEPLYQNIDQ